VTQALSVIHVLIPSKATEYRLPQQTDQRMTAVLARACISERRPRYRAQPKRIIEFAIRQQSGIGRDHGTAKLHQKAAVEIELENPVL
jgi:hypothetical protein